MYDSNSFFRLWPFFFLISMSFLYSISLITLFFLSLIIKSPITLCLALIHLFFYALFSLIDSLGITVSFVPLCLSLSPFFFPFFSSVFYSFHSLLFVWWSIWRRRRRHAFEINSNPDEKYFCSKNEKIPTQRSSSTSQTFFSLFSTGADVINKFWSSTAMLHWNKVF